MRITGFAAALLAVMVIASVLLLWGGVKLARTGENRSKGLLMILAAAVLFANVLIWTVPL